VRVYRIDDRPIQPDSAYLITGIWKSSGCWPEAAGRCLPTTLGVTLAVLTSDSARYDQRGKGRAARVARPTGWPA